MNSTMMDSNSQRARGGGVGGGTGTAWKSEDAQWRALFAALDKDSNGYVDKTELRQTMFEVGLELSENDVDTMMKAAGVAIKDRIFYEDFVRMMTGKIGQSQRKAIKVTREAGSTREPSMYSLVDADDDDDQLDNAIQAMRVAFAMFDKDGDGHITVQEVHDTMTSLGIKIGLKEVKEIVKRVDTDRDGSINFIEFRQLMTKYQTTVEKESKLQSVVESSSQVNQHNQQCGPERELQDAFHIFDKDQDGFLNAYDLRSTMAQLGLILSEDDVHAMMKSVGIGPHGKISFHDFCRIYTSKTADDAETRLSSSRSNNKLSKRQENELRAVFKVFDMDHDGYITMEEVIQVLESMGFLPSQSCIEDIFRQVDLDGNGKIDFREFLLLVHNYERPLPEDIEMKEMFNALDKDRNGFIDREELKASFADLGVPLTDKDVEAMMAEAEVRTDRIYYEDFIHMMTGKLYVVPSAKRLSTPNVEPLQRSPSHPQTDAAVAMPTTAACRGPVDDVTVKVRQHAAAVSHNERVAAVAEARRKRETSGHHPSSNGGVRNIGETQCQQTKRLENNMRSGLSFEVQEFFRESTSTDTLPTIPSSQSSVENDSCPVNSNKQSATNDKVPSTWLAFKVFDRNSDGYISKLELHKTMVDLGIDLSRQDLDIMMEEADINKDGRIDYSEFSKLMKGSFESYAKQAAAMQNTTPLAAAANHTGNGTVTSGNGLTPSRKSSVGVVGAASSPGRRRPPPPPPNTRPPPVPPRPEPGTFTLPPSSNSASYVTEAADSQSSIAVAVTGLGFAAEDEIRAAFRVFDLDGDGLIDSSELRLTMSNLGEALTDSDVDAMIHAVDRNDDGKIDYEEFILMLRGSTK